MKTEWELKIHDGWWLNSDVYRTFLKMLLVFMKSLITLEHKHVHVISQTENMLFFGSWKYDTNFQLEHAMAFCWKRQNFSFRNMNIKLKTGETRGFVSRSRNCRVDPAHYAMFSRYLIWYTYEHTAKFY